MMSITGRHAGDYRRFADDHANALITPHKLVFRSGADYYLSDGYSIKYCAKINNVATVRI